MHPYDDNFITQQKYLKLLKKLLKSMPNYKPIKTEFTSDDHSSQLYSYIAVAIIVVALLIAILVYCCSKKPKFSTLCSRRASEAQQPLHIANADYTGYESVEMSLHRIDL